MTDKPTLHLLMGLPGSGKSTLARVLQDLTGATLFSSDEERLKLFPNPCFSQEEHDNLYGIIDHNVEHLLQAGRTVIYDANLNRKHHRQEKYDLAVKYDAKVILWSVQVPSELAKERRMTKQDKRLIPDGETSARMFDRIAQVIEEPGTNEHCIKVDGTRINSQYVKELLQTS